MKAKKHWYIIAYDIRHPKRLSKLHYRLVKQALALQKSVFLLKANPKQLEHIRNTILGIINPHQDDVRIYPVYHPETLWTAGQQYQPLASLYPTPPTDHTGEKTGLLSRLFRRKS